MFSNILKKIRKTDGEGDAGGDVFSTPQSQAKDILHLIEPLLLDASWRAYSLIKEFDKSYHRDTVRSVPAIDALSKVVEYEGDFSRFRDGEKHLLKTLESGFLVYADIIHVLIDHHNDHEVAKRLFSEEPKLYHLVPAEYANEEHVIEYLVEHVRNVQWHLESFASNFETAIIASMDSVE